jgi:nicotinamidase/pyrazinamidase
MPYKIVATDALLVIDVQNDFCPGGNLAVPHGDALVPVVNRLGKRFQHVILTQDWHPSGHRSFASANPGRQPFETVAFAYGPQVLWPDHCEQGTPGAGFHTGMHIPHAELIIRKGTRRDIDSYSAYLRERGLTRVFLAGLAFDFCVRYSAEDAHRVGFEVVVVEDACRGIDVEGSMEATRQSLASLNIPRAAAQTIG